MNSYEREALEAIRKGDALQRKQEFDFRLRAGIRKRFGQRFDGAHRGFLEDELYVIGVLGAECLFLHYLDVLDRVKRFAFPYICSTQNTSLVCYCLGITQVDPVMTHSRFEHFLSLGTERIPWLWVELSSSKKEEALRRLGFSRHFIYFCEKERICEVPVQQAEHFLCIRRSKIQLSLQRLFLTACRRSGCRGASPNMSISARQSAAGRSE